MEDWIGTACGIMRVNRITQKDLAAYLGVTNDYISMVMTGKRSPKGMKEKILSAIDELCKNNDTTASG